MTQLSNSTINAVADLKPGYKLGAADVALLQEMARRLLAVEGLEPVAWEVKGILCHTLDEANRYVGQPEPLYAAPQPAPVAQPVQVPQGYTVRAGHPINEGERGVMIPKQGGEWLHRFDVEHALHVAGIKLKNEGE